MTTQLYRYPLDITGVNPDNRVVGELHDLPNRNVRAIAPLYGAFFTDSVVVRDRNSGLVLTKGTQWRATEMFEFPTGRYGKEICGIILIVDTTVSNNVEIDYQVLGGEYGTNLDVVLQMLNQYTEDRPVAWPDLIGKPDAFTPAAHYHDAGDIYGFEYVVNALERLRQAVLLGDVASHDEILKYIDRQTEDLRVQIAQNQQSLNNHITNMSNPHATTKAQVGLGDVQNYPMATNEQALAGTISVAYMSPSTTKYVVDTLAVTPLSTHIARTDNPHAVTKAQTGLGSVENYGIATQAEAQAGTSNVKYMTPLRTKEAIDVIAGAALALHTSRVDNPHSVTKAQVGLGLVENYAVATQAEAQAGVVSTKYMTPLRTKEAIDAMVGQTLSSHISRTDNPHATTKAQVGLGLVENYGVATQTQAELGVDNATYMTPLRVKQAIVKIGGDALAAHASRVDNPHATTKAQVGLGSVENYGVATLAEAQAGTINTKYMTPLRVKEAIDALSTGFLNNHVSRVDNPHSVTKAQVGLSNVQNYGVATNAEALAGTSDVKYMTPLLVNDRVVAHENSGAHDARYVRLNTAVSASLRESGGQLQAYIAGAWRVVWPPQWQG